MKMKDIKPGMAVAVPDKEFNDSRSRMLEGYEALQGVVLAVGRYRTQVQGLCRTTIAVESPHSSTCVVVMVQVPKSWQQMKLETGREPGWNEYQQARKQITPTTEWAVTTVPTSALMPLALWEEVREERLMIESEVDALSERRKALQKEAQVLLGKLVKWDPKNIVISRSWHYYQDPEKPTMAFEGTMQLDLNKFTKTDRKRYDKLLAEVKAIEERLSCVR